MPFVAVFLSKMMAAKNNFTLMTVGLSGIEIKVITHS
jgi:hypothetical protein